MFEILWTILIPIFITIMFFLHVLYKIPRILNLPTQIKEYKHIRNTLKILIAIILLLLISVILSETTKLYMDMSIFYIKNKIIEQSIASLESLKYIILVPIAFITMLYLIVLVNIHKIIEIPSEMNEDKKINKIIKLILTSIFALLIFLLSSYIYYKISLNYFNDILTIL